jgi:hypothetical protein
MASQVAANSSEVREWFASACTEVPLRVARSSHYAVVLSRRSVRIDTALSGSSSITRSIMGRLPGTIFGSGSEPLQQRSGIACARVGVVAISGRDTGRGGNDERSTRRELERERQAGHTRSPAAAHDPEYRALHPPGRGRKP